MADDENQAGEEGVSENADASVAATDELEIGVEAPADEAAAEDIPAEEPAADEQSDVPEEENTEGVLLEDADDGLSVIDTANSLMGMRDVQLDFRAILGTVDLPLDQFLKLGRGAIVELQQNKDDHVVIEVNGHSIGKADITVVEEHVGVIVTVIGEGGVAGALGDDMDMGAAMEGGDDMDMSAAMGGDDDMSAAMEGGEDDMAAMMAAMDNGE